MECLAVYGARHKIKSSAATAESLDPPSLDEFAAREAAEREAEGLRDRLARAQDDLRMYRSRAAAAEKRQHEAERIREAVFGLKAAPLEAPDWLIERTASKGAPHVPVLFTSDFQWGETIDRSEMDGVNEFSVAIAERRYRLLIERALDISLNHLSKNRYSGIVYLRGGDQVSGDIHQELRETNELAAIPAVRSLVTAEDWGLRQLADAFGRVHVISVPGNHGRTSIKPPHKGIAASNYDTVSAWWLEDRFRGDTRLTWQTPNSTDAVFDLHGRNYLLTHGDNIGSSGGQGFIGPAATILRGMKKTMDEYATLGVHLSKMFVGHFHTAYDLGRGYSNGSLPGYSEYARGFRMGPEPPQQWLIYFHPKYGATSQWKVQLEAYPRGQAAGAYPFAEES
jgi:hypothetical protein